MQKVKEKVKYVKPEIVVSYSEKELEKQVINVYGISPISNNFSHINTNPNPNLP